MKKFLKIFFLSIGILVALVAGNYFLVKKLDKELVEKKDDYVSSYDPKEPYLLPSVFINGERFYIKMATTTGDTVMAFGDSGGGISMIMPATVDKLHISSMVKTGLLKGAMPFHYVTFSDFIRDGRIPPPCPIRSMIIRRPLSRVTTPFFVVPPMEEELKFLIGVMNLDIFLGQNFFMGRSWTIDYIKKQIWVNTPLTEAEANKPGVQRIGFKKNSSNEKIFGHPSMTIVVDGETIEVLFDTGATIVLSEDGKKQLNTNEKTIGGSFIAASVFDKWRKDHPDWKYYPKADYGKDVIEVPVVTIGGYEVGPVLFAKRQDEAWSKGMIHTMDKVVRGAIGGSAMKYLRVTIDYNTALIKFEK